MKLNELRDNDGATQGAQARRPRHRLRHGQDRRPWREGPELALGRRHQRLRGRPDADLSSPAEARLQEPVHARTSTRSRWAASRQPSTPGSSTPRRPSTIEALVKAGVIRRAKDGVRLLGAGEIKSKVTFDIAGASKSAIEKVEKAGGSVKLPEKAAAE